MVVKLEWYTHTERASEEERERALAKANRKAMVKAKAKAKRSFSILRSRCRQCFSLPMYKLLFDLYNKCKHIHMHKALSRDDDDTIGTLYPL